MFGSPCSLVICWISFHSFLNSFSIQFTVSVHLSHDATFDLLDIIIGFRPLMLLLRPCVTHLHNLKTNPLAITLRLPPSSLASTLFHPSIDDPLFHHICNDFSYTLSTNKFTFTTPIPLITQQTINLLLSTYLSHR